MALRISVWDSKEIQAVILAMKGMERELAKVIRRETKRWIEPEWQKAVAEQSTTYQEGRVLVTTARVQVSDQNVTLRSAHIGKSVSGGLKPHELAHSVEFGADREYQRTVAGRNGGKPYQRHTRRQFRKRNLKGYVVYPAAAGIIPRLASLWVQTTIRTFYETIEKAK